MLLRALLLLNGCQYYDARKWDEIEARGVGPEEFLGGGRSLWRSLGITETCAERMEMMTDTGFVERELDLCARSGARVVTCRDAVYPKALRDIESPPLLLYARGDIFSPGANAVGVVGTRRCSAYGVGVAREIGRRCGGANVTVVSGGAKGIDGAAHSGCLEAGGRTIAIFGTGIDVVYPTEHRALFERITERGMLCTEYPFGSKGEAWRFPRRNRLIVGMTSRTVVVEAPLKSGAMITARMAGSWGREIWSVPGRINDSRCEGSNMLIYDGANALVDIGLLFDAQADLFAPIRPDPAPKREVPALSDTDKLLVAILTDGGGRTIDNLASEAKMSPAEVLKAISVLSLRGIVTTTGAGRYSLAD